MIKFDVHRETVDRDRGVAASWTDPIWLDVSDVFSVRADADPEWSVLTFRPGAGPRSLIVRGTAEAVAAQISAEMDRSRRPARRARETGS